MCLPRLGHKGTAASTLASWIACTGESQAPRGEDIQAVLWGPTPWEGAILKVNPQAPIKPSLNCNPS